MRIGGVSRGIPKGPGPHICYHDATDGNLEYAVKVGGSWTLETVASSGSTGEYSSLALDRIRCPPVRAASESCSRWSC